MSSENDNYRAIQLSMAMGLASLYSIPPDRVNVEGNPHHRRESWSWQTRSLSGDSQRRRRAERKRQRLAKKKGRHQ